jgi:CRP-like cAMP-binding protein
MTGTPNALRVVAETDVEFLELDAATVLAGAQKDVSLAWAIAREVSLRLCDTEDMLQSGVGLSVMERVARALLDMAGELDGAVVVSQEALAERVGSSRESVGKTVRDLEARGLIQLSRRRLQVLDATTLASVAARD